MTRAGSTAAAVGLGATGAPVASSLISAGHGVAGFNPSPRKVESPIARGGRGASSIMEAVEGQASRRDRNAIHAGQPA